MATPRLAQSPTCLNCLRRLWQPSAPSPLSFTQTRSKATKAELEDLQGIPVRLLRNIPQYGRKNAIIRVKAGRMRNIWFPRGAAEYMTKQRFADLGLTEAAIGVRDRAFGTKLAIKVETDKKKKASKPKRKEILTLPPEDIRSILITLLPQTLVFPRIPVITTPTAPPEPEIPRSPSLAANAVTSNSPAKTEEPVKAIFGSVAKSDVLMLIKQKLLADPRGSRIALEPEAITLLGLHPEHDGADRIKTLGSFEVLIAPGVTAEGQVLEPVRRAIEVVAGESSS